MKMTIDILITPDGQIKADVVDGHQGKACITKLLAGLQELLGEPGTTKLKPEYQLDMEVINILRQQEVKG